MVTPASPEDSPTSAVGGSVPTGRARTATWSNVSDGLLDLADAELPEDDEASHTAAPLPDDSRTSSSFGHALEPVLRRACQERLGEVTWFRVDWQRGGALTGYAKYQADDRAEPYAVVVKLPVPPCERHWLVALQNHRDVVPRVFAHGEAVNGYDLAWVVMERLNHGPLGHAWGGGEFDLLTESVGRFYAAANTHPRIGEPLQKDWQAIYDLSRKHVQHFSLAEPQRWNKALKRAHRKLKHWVAQWEQRPCADWCHGDLHLGNAMTRDPAPAGPALLFDFAKTRVGHWVEDAVYFEHLFWARRDRLDGRKLCSMIAHERRKHGVSVHDDWTKYADLKRALLAMSTPAMLQHDGDPRHVHAALEVLERAV